MKAAAGGSARSDGERRVMQSPSAAAERRKQSIAVSFHLIVFGDELILNAF